GRLGRDHLRDDRPYQEAEAVWLGLERTRADGGDEPLEGRVAPREVPPGPTKGVVERKGRRAHGHPRRPKRGSGDHLCNRFAVSLGRARGARSPEAHGETARRTRPEALFPGRLLHQAEADRLGARLADVPDQAAPAQQTDDVVTDVDLPPEEPLVGGTLVV